MRLEREGRTNPSRATIHRILRSHGLVTPQPRKRPRSSWHLFAADQPNEMWQADFTHWHLPDGTDIEILNFLDDHSRLLLTARAFTPVTGTAVTDTFVDLVHDYGPPAAMLTDNGMVFTTRFAQGSRVLKTLNSFERALADLGIGRAHKGRPVRLLIDHDDVLVADLETGTILAEFTIEPTRGYQAKKKGPGENQGPSQ